MHCLLGFVLNISVTAFIGEFSQISTVIRKRQRQRRSTSERIQWGLPSLGRFMLGVSN